ncbi:MAG: hypothetical protein RLN89_06735 [Parvibaculum sp.]
MRFEQNHIAANAKVIAKINDGADASAFALAGSVIAIALIADLLVKAVAVAKIVVPPGL